MIEGSIEARNKTRVRSIPAKIEPCLTEASDESALRRP
jgi:hypothetical protein